MAPDYTGSATIKRHSGSFNSKSQKDLSAQKKPERYNKNLDSVAEIMYRNMKQRQTMSSADKTKKSPEQIKKRDLLLKRDLMMKQGEKARRMNLEALERSKKKGQARKSTDEAVDSFVVEMTNDFIASK